MTDIHTTSRQRVVRPRSQPALTLYSSVTYLPVKSVRARNILKNLGIKPSNDWMSAPEFDPLSIAELIQRGAAELLRQPNLGWITFAEIEYTLNRFGWSLYLEHEREWSHQRLAVLVRRLRVSRADPLLAKAQSERNAQIKARWLAGEPVKAIANAFGLSYERVRQIGLQLGLPPRRGKAPR
jgi:hypothetical protein